MHLLHNNGLHPLAIFAFATEIFALVTKASITDVYDDEAVLDLNDAELCLAHDAETFFEDHYPCACCHG